MDLQVLWTIILHGPGQFLPDEKPQPKRPRWRAGPHPFLGLMNNCAQQAFASFTHALCHHGGLPNFLTTYTGAHANFHLAYQLTC